MDPTHHTIQTLDDLRLDPQNPNRGTARGQAALAHSLKTYGAGRSVLADKYGMLLAGGASALPNSSQ